MESTKIQHGRSSHDATRSCRGAAPGETSPSPTPAQARAYRGCPPAITPSHAMLDQRPCTRALLGHGAFPQPLVVYRLTALNGAWTTRQVRNLDTGLGTRVDTLHTAPAAHEHCERPARTLTEPTHSDTDSASRPLPREPDAIGSDNYDHGRADTLDRFTMDTIIIIAKHSASQENLAVSKRFPRAAGVADPYLATPLPGPFRRHFPDKSRLHDGPSAVIAFLSLLVRHPPANGGCLRDGRMETA